MDPTTTAPAAELLGLCAGLLRRAADLMSGPELAEPRAHAGCAALEADRALAALKRALLAELARLESPGPRDQFRPPAARTDDPHNHTEGLSGTN